MKSITPPALKIATHTSPEKAALVDHSSPRRSSSAVPHSSRTWTARYMRFYNEERFHQALGYQAPAPFYDGLTPDSQRTSESATSVGITSSLDFGTGCSNPMLPRHR